MAASACFSTWWAVVLILLAGVAAYANGLNGEFVFDDRLAILNNPTIQQGWAGALRSPPGGGPAVGRPLVNFSYALNYSISGLRTWSYHWGNLAIHLLAALTLFGLVRRTLASPVLAERWGARAGPLALAAAVGWMVHPLQTESVTFMAQRAEALMGLFYLLTLYGLARALAAKPGAAYWLAGSVAACLLGMLCKEVMVTAPLMAWLYDRTFGAGTFAGAWRQRGKYYLALAATWVPLGLLVWGAGSRGGSAGFHAGLAWQEYAWAQFSVMSHYLKLTLWPHPLMLDYGVTLAQSIGGWPPAVGLILALGLGTIYLLWKRPALGFLGAWFFVILAPSSSVIPVATEIAAEHRMYLPLAAVVLLGVLGLEALTRPKAFTLVVTAVALIWAGVTITRNMDYQTALGGYRAMVASAPANDRTHLNLGVALAQAGLLPESVQEYKAALQMNPQSADTEYDLALALAGGGQAEEAILHYRSAVRINPDYLLAHSDLANLYIKTGAIDNAIKEFLEVARLDPASAGARLNLGHAYSMTHQWPLALEQYRQATQLAPENPETFYYLANALAQAGNFTEAYAYYSLVLKLKPDHVAAMGNRAFCLMQLGRVDEAAREYEQVLRLDPANKTANDGLVRIRQKQAAGAPAGGTAQPPK